MNNFVTYQEKFYKGEEKNEKNASNTLSSSPWKRIMGQENWSTKLIGDLSKNSFSPPVAKLIYNQLVIQIHKFR